MSHNRYGKKDNDLIWESLINKTQHRSNESMQNLWENDLQYIEQFLIDEGLMDTVKKGFGSVKQFASDKLLKPVMNFLAGIIAKDPALAQKAQAAAAQGPEALQQLANTEGDPSVAQQLTSGTNGQAHGESYTNQFNMNQIICDVLVEEQLITSQHAQIIQEKYFRATINELHKQLKQGEGCPWMPATALVSENTAATVHAQINDLMKQAYAANKNFRPSKLYKHMMDNNPKFADFVNKQGNVQPEPEGQPVDVDGDGQPEDTGAGADGAQASDPTGETSPQSPQSDVPDVSGIDPTAGQAKPGLLGKVWNFIKSNKGAIGGAAAMGLAAAIAASTGNPMAFSYLVGGLVGGTRGAIKGATQTQGGFMDKLKGAANQAGADYMKAGGLAAAASGIGQAAGDMVNATPDTATTPEPAVDAPDVTGVDDPYGVDAAGSPEDFNAGGVYDTETPEIGGTSGGFDPETGQSNMDITDDEAAAFNAADEAGSGPRGAEGPAGNEQLPYDPNDKGGLFKRSGVDQYHYDQFKKSLTPQQQRSLGGRGLQAAYLKYLKSANTPVNPDMFG